jgi:hypothetical protein
MQKWLALRSHQSHVTPFVAELDIETFARWWAREAFVDSTAALRGSCNGDPR